MAKVIHTIFCLMLLRVPLQRLVINKFVSLGVYHVAFGLFHKVLIKDAVHLRRLMIKLYY